MYLQVRIQPDANDNSVLMLCDERGVPLPNQTKVELYNSVTDVVKVNVSFIVDGDRVKLVAS
jgi:hypothetical protein